MASVSSKPASAPPTLPPPPPPPSHQEEAREDGRDEGRDEGREEGPQDGRFSIADLPKTWHFTSVLPPDPAYPTPAHSHRTPREHIVPRQVRGAMFTWVRPDPPRDPELLAVSPAAMADLNLRPGEERTEPFRQTVAGARLHGWDESTGRGGYPWAQCYGGFQFGIWAGQLGDGRAISLFETTNPSTNVRYELQLKGAGLTPYSRFADGRAVLRSSIREWVVSEALHALGVPTTRALSLTLLPHERVMRERAEPGAVVLRFAQSWLRLGSFDLLRARQDRDLLRRLATYVAEDVFAGWGTLPGRLPDRPPDDGNHGDPSPSSPRRAVPADEVEGPAETAENRFARLYREIVRRNAETVAKWQAYGFMNGVLNTDNTSIYGLSIDYGPFAFMDDFDRDYTPNHDDHLLRYCYKNQPTVIWWNLVRLGEALGELIGAGPAVDDAAFIRNGVEGADQQAALVARAETIISRVGKEYEAVFVAQYRRLMTARLGLRTFAPQDSAQLFDALLDVMAALRLDFNHFFRRLGTVGLGDIATDDARREKASLFFHREGPPSTASEPEARGRIAAWLDKWRCRAAEDWGEGPEADAARAAAMRRVNPNFVPRGWILDEVIGRVEAGGERAVLDRIMRMATHPFQDGWGGGDEEEQEERRWVGDAPRTKRSLQCSCSS